MTRIRVDQSVNISTFGQLLSVRVHSHPPTLPQQRRGSERNVENASETYKQQHHTTVLTASQLATTVPAEKTRI